MLDSVLKEMAVGYLEDNQTAIGEIAFLLGFSEVSVFHRAFKRWTNHTPKDFRLLAQSNSPI